MEALRLQLDGAIARIVIDHPQRRNALTRAMWRAIPKWVAQAVSTSGVRLLTLQGSQPGLFAAGADISEFEQTYASAEETARANGEIQAAVEALSSCPLPVVALIDGPCVGGGMALATGCDFRVASDQARFAITPSRLGLSYHPSDLRRLVQACGIGAASELLFSGVAWSASRALQAGLVNQVINSADFVSITDALLRAIASNSVDANRALKRGLKAVIGREETTIAESLQEFEQLFQRPDFLEGRDAFLQKRSAVFPSHGSSE